MVAIARSHKRPACGSDLYFAEVLMPHALQDTIVAIASAPGGAARGILRISGPQVVECLEKCFVPSHAIVLTDLRQAQVVPGSLQLAGSATRESFDPGLPGILTNSATASGRLPGDLYLWPTNRSYTREPAAEFHTLGSPPLLAAAIAALCASGIRLAEPGEFTLRAFLAGRLDLTQAEAVLGVIDAAGSKELGVALAQLAGGLAEPLARLRGRLLDLLAHLEAGLDFVEEDIEFISATELAAQLAGAADETARLAAQMSARSAGGGAVRIVLAGWPNVGKSSLLNALAGSSAAIVSPQAGTTRDYVAHAARLAGLDCLLIDTAGVEPETNSGGMAHASQEQTARVRNEAHLELFCLDSTRPLVPWERQELSTGENSPRRLVVLTKCDAPLKTDYLGPALATSSRTGSGLAELARAVRERISGLSDSESHVVAATADRCRESLRLAAESLSRATETAHARLGEELVAAEIRVALDELGKVAGAVYTDDILDRIFSRFCIGK